jgi:hypothetical protein
MLLEDKNLLAIIFVQGVMCDIKRASRDEGDRGMT